MKKSFFQSIAEKYKQFKKSNVAQVIGMTFRWAYNLRSILLSIPVAVVALALAVRNLTQLPAEVGIVLQANGEYQWVIGRGVAAIVPLLITALCIAMMLLSKKVLYPWLISVFSLALPLVLWLSNMFVF